MGGQYYPYTLSLILIYNMNTLNLFFAGGSDQLDSLYAACKLYATRQSTLIKNAVIDEERDEATLQLAYINQIIKQIDLAGDLV